MVILLKFLLFPYFTVPSIHYIGIQDKSKQEHKMLLDILNELILVNYKTQSQVRIMFLLESIRNEKGRRITINTQS